MGILFKYGMFAFDFKRANWNAFFIYSVSELLAFWHQYYKTFTAVIYKNVPNKLECLSMAGLSSLV